jgi:hypothetical protein
MAAAAMSVAQREPGWIYSRKWDLTLIIFSSALVPLPFLVSWIAQTTGWMTQEKAVDMINIVVSLLIGGPHLFSTISYTFLDNRFRTKHPAYTYFALLLPPIVLYLGITHYTALITFFFTWASLHVLHQIMYLTDCYRERGGLMEIKWSRLVDYGLILTGLYPIGIYKISQEQFHVGGVLLPYPGFLKPYPLAALAGAVFAGFLIAWIVKTAAEFREGRGNVPKTLLIAITTVVSFCLPMGSNMDVLFQGYNTWHSFQYLFLLWMINRLRDQRGEIEDGFMRRLIRRKGMGAYYLCFVAATGITVVLTLMVRATTPLSTDQSYFVVVLSVLLMHYYFDHFLFVQPRMVD